MLQIWTRPGCLLDAESTCIKDAGRFVRREDTSLYCRVEKSVRRDGHCGYAYKIQENHTIVNGTQDNQRC